MNTEQIEQRIQLLNSMNQISEKMTEIILIRYYDKLGIDNKYIISMMMDAYQTTMVFSYAMTNAFVSQAGILLRQLLEQTSISYILVTHPETLSKYIEHFKFRTKIKDFMKWQQIDMIAKEYNVHKSTALSFLDYGWIDIKDCGENEMLAYAGFNDILSWKKQWLDKLAHSSFTNINLAGVDLDFPILNNFMEIAAKLFDYLCVAFHNLTGFDFVIDNKDLFKCFRNSYSEFKP